MTNDLQNIYNSLFRFLRRELPGKDASEFIKNAEANADVANDLETFRAAKVLIEENELIDFKQTAKGYVKQAKAKRVIKSIAAIVAAIAGGIALYLFFSDSNDKEIIPIENDNKEIIVIDSLKQKNKAIPEVEELNNIEESEDVIEKPATKSKDTANKVEIITGEPIEENEIESTIAEEENATIKINNSLEVIEPENEKPKETEKPNNEITVEQEKTQNSNKEEIAEDNTDFWDDNEIKADPCDVNIPSTYEPMFDDEIIITESAVSDGTIMIYNEQMKEVFKLNFQEATELIWNGRDMSEEYVPMGLYKVIIFYTNGSKCIKDITILER